MCFCPLPEPDLYSVLGLDKQCSSDAIKKRYKHLASVFHPDKHVTKGEDTISEAKDQFAKIQEAYEVRVESSRVESSRTMPLLSISMMTMILLFCCRRRPAPQILHDDQRRVIYDLYGMAGVRAGSSIVENTSPQEFKEEMEREKRRQEEVRLL